jgi:hypothetical protein
MLDKVNDIDKKSFNPSPDHSNDQKLPLKNAKSKEYSPKKNLNTFEYNEKKSKKTKGKFL